jgi:hypothetical protein
MPIRIENGMRWHKIVFHYLCPLPSECHGGRKHVPAALKKRPWRSRSPITPLRTTKLYNRTGDEITLDEVQRIAHVRLRSSARGNTDSLEPVPFKSFVGTVPPPNYSFNTLDGIVERVSFFGSGSVCN